jgi:type I restriction enzyme S subunit
MKYQTYPAYKDSGVEWLGDVPEHWDVIQIKHLSAVQRGASPRPIDDPKYFDDEGEYAWVRIADVSSSDGVLRETTQRLSNLGNSLSVKIHSGELFISIAGTVGKPCISEIKACIHDGFVYFPTLKIPPIFLYRIFEAGLCYGGLGKLGTQLNLNTETIGAIRVALPNSKELEHVLNFLDHETAKIDTLIEKQQRLIELLKEKRQAVISHAVTKGLNPNAPMKESGVEWLGDVPEGWVVNNITYIFNAIGDVDHYMPQSVENGIPYVMTGDLKEFVSGISFKDCKQVSHEDYVKLSQKIKSSKGDLIVARYATIGTASYVDIDTDFLVSYSCVTIKPNPSKVFGLYLFYYFKSNSFLQGIQNQINTNTQGNVGISDLKKVKMALPTLDEQSKIIEFLDKKVSKVDTLIEKSNSAIELMQERRTALISAAVTGKIDVRNFTN